MKSKEYYSKLKEQGKIESEDFNKFLETVPDYEIPDPIYKTLQDNFLTRDRAFSDSKIGGKIRSEVYDGVDAEITKLLPVLDVFDADKISQEKDTKKRIAMFEDAIKNIVTKAKKENPSKEEEVKELNKQNAELLQKIKAINIERDTEKKELLTKFETEKKGILLDHTLRAKIAKFEFAPEHKDIKEDITNIILLGLKNNNVLTADERGEIRVQFLNAQGQAEDKFNGNDPVTIDKLLEEKVSPYLKRNNAGDETKKDLGGRKTIIDKAPLTGNETLAQRRARVYVQ